MKNMISLRSKLQKRNFLYLFAIVLLTSIFSCSKEQIFENEAQEAETKQVTTNNLLQENNLQSKFDFYESSIPTAGLDYSSNDEPIAQIYNALTWKFSSGGIDIWEEMASSSIPLEDLRFGDFNGDDKTDVFTKIGKQWVFSSGGTAKWDNLATSSVPIEKLRFGDFDGDGRTDVFAIFGDRWKFSSQGSSSWADLAISSIPLEDLRFGDFDGDGVTDVFTACEN